MKVLFIEDEEHFKGFEIDIDSSYVVFSGYWKLSLGIISLKDFDMVVSTIQHSRLSNKIIKKANFLNITTVLIVDGIFEWNNSYNNKYLNSLGMPLYSENIYDYVYLCSTPIIRKYLKGNNDVRYLGFHNKRIFSFTAEDEDEDEDKDKDKVLISFANTPFFNIVEKNNLYSLITKLTDALNNIGVDYDFRIFNNDIVTELGIECSKNIISSDFRDIVKNYKAIISTPSSVCLDAMGYNIPVAQLYYRDTPQSFQTPWTIHQGIDIENTLLSLINPEMEKIRYQSTVYAEHILGSIDLLSLESFNSSAKREHSYDCNLSFIEPEVIKRVVYQKIKKKPKLQKILKTVFKR